MVITNRIKNAANKMLYIVFFRNSLDAVAIIGGSDPSLFKGQLSYIDLIQPADFYRIPIVVGVGDQHNLACNGECSVVIDTGAPFMYGPASKIKIINEAIGGYVSWYYI